MRVDRIAGFVVLIVGCIGCDSQSIDPGDNAELQVEVLLEDESLGISDISKLSSKEVSVSGVSSEVVTIAQIIEETSGISGDALDEYLCNYESGVDGFRPTSKGDRCPMVSCKYAALSYLDLGSGDLFYAEEAPQKNGCYHVKSLSKVLMYKANQNASLIHLYVNGTWIAQVDADLLTHHTLSDGRLAVTIGDVIGAADPEQTLSNYTCDFRSVPEGRIISEYDAACQPRTCDELQNQYIILKDRSVSDDNESVQACYEISSVDAIYMIEQVSSYEPHEIVINIDGKYAATVDMSALSDKAFTAGGLAVIHVSDIIESAGLAVDLNSSYCDYWGEDGYHPADRDYCTEVRSCRYTYESYVSLVTHKMTMAEAPHACYNVSWLDQIDIYTVNPNL